MRPADSRISIKSARLGTFGQIAVGLAGQIANTGWTGYIRGDYRTGDHIEALGVSAGVRYSFSPDPSIRKLTPAGSEVASVDAPFAVNWTGLTVGASVGAAWSQTQQAFPVVGNPAGAFPVSNAVPLNTIYPYSLSTNRVTNPHAAGIMAGGQIGANYQIRDFVIGVDGDLSWVNAKGGRSCPNAVYYSCETQVDLLAFATGRVGYTWGRTLFYAKGGAAFGDVADRFQQNNTPGSSLLTYTTLGRGVARETLVGWAAGGGIEVALTDRWSAKAEYLHYDLGAKQVTYTPQAIVANTERAGDLVRLGVNYRFGPIAETKALPLVAKY